MKEIYWASNLKWLRKKQNISQAEIADKLQFTVTQWSNWESKNVFPNVKDLIALSNYFGYKIDELLHDDLSKVQLVGNYKGMSELESYKKSNSILEETLLLNAKNHERLSSLQQDKILNLEKEIIELKEQIKKRATVKAIG